MEANKSLLDLLNNNTPKQKNDREQLLALFRPQQSAESVVKSSEIPSQSPSVAASGSIGGSLRNSNANDLLATLMGTTSPRPAATPKSRAEDSANLLSTLMGSSKPSTPSSIPERQSYTSPTVQTSYVNPRHEYLTNRSNPTQNHKPNPDNEAVSKPLFHAINPFDELEQVTRARQIVSPSTTEKPMELSRAMEVAQGDSTDKQTLTSPQQRHDSTPNLPFSHEHHADEQQESTSAADDRAVSKAVGRRQEPATTSSVEETNDKGDANVTPALRLATAESSVCNISPTAPYTSVLSQSMPVTKMSIKSDVLNRNIIAASRKYFAYPLVKDTSNGAIRLVDQDDGSTALLEHHNSKVINLNFAKSADGDGLNALISTDIDSNVVIWSIAPGLIAERIFEVAGPSDGAHKSRAKWNHDGNYFAVSITSRIYVFDYRSILAANKAQRIKLHPDAKHCLCVCKSDKAVKDYSFSLDGTAMVAVDKNGNLRLWILDSSGKTIDFVASISVGDRQLLSVEYVSSRHVIVGTQSNECLILVDILAAKNAQELRLPSPSNASKDPLFSKASFISALGLFLVVNERRQSIYMMKLDLPAATETAAAIIQGLSPKSSHIVAAGYFGVLLEFGITKDYQKFLSFTTLINESNLDIFIGHEKGYNLFTEPLSKITQMVQCAQILESSAVAKMQSIGQLIMPVETAEAKLSRASSPDVQPSRQAPSRTVKKNSSNTSRNGDGSAAMTVEPRINEISARLETTLRASFAAELQKAQTQTKTQIEAMQASNDTRHETILRLVSETLSKNTTKVLKSTIAELFEQSVLPNIQSSIDTAISRDLQPAVSAAVEKTLTKELKEATHEAVEKAFTGCGIVSELETATSTMKDNLNARHKHMEQNLAGALVRLDAQILERQKSDSEKIDKLMRTVEALEQRIAAMSVVSAPLPKRENVQHQTIASMQQQVPLQQQQSPYQNTRSVAPTAQPPVQAQMPLEDFAKYHDLIMDFVTKTQKISAGDFEGVPFVRQFLSWQPESRVKDGITKSLALDQLQLLAFVHALASELKEEDAFNRVHWIASAVHCLDTARDPRLDVLGPRLIGIIRGNLVKAAEQAAPNSQYGHLLGSVLSQIPAR